jgi:hypothetical protein
MRFIGCDLHASQQSIAILDVETGAVSKKTLTHEGEVVREFYASLLPPVVVGDRSDGVDGMNPAPQMPHFVSPERTSISSANA